MYARKMRFTYRLRDLLLFASLTAIAGGIFGSYYNQNKPFKRTTPFSIESNITEVPAVIHPDRESLDILFLDTDKASEMKSELAKKGMDAYVLNPNLSDEILSPVEAVHPEQLATEESVLIVSSENIKGPRYVLPFPDAQKLRALGIKTVYLHGEFGRDDSPDRQFMSLGYDWGNRIFNLNEFMEGISESGLEVVLSPLKGSSDAQLDILQGDLDNWPSYIQEGKTGKIKKH